MSDNKVIPLDTDVTVEIPTEGEILAAKLDDAFVPGFEVEFTPDEAEALGAFAEDALSEADAKASAIDIE